MKIAIALTDQSFARTKSMGIFNVSMGLTRGLMKHPSVKELHILGNNECADVFADAPPHVHLHLMDKPVPRRFARVWWDQFGVSAATQKIAPDWLILPKGFPPFFPCLGKTRMACYVHDVIWEYYSELSKQGKNPFPRHENIYFRTLGLRALRKSDIVLTSTKFNADRFRAHVPECRTSVVGIGFAPAIPSAQTPENRAPGVLFFASTFPHKLTSTGVQRLQTWLSQRKDAETVTIHCIGHLPENLSISDVNWVRHGRVDSTTLDKLMKDECRVSVYFSDYEGFGMPPVESLRVGLPCVCSDIPPIRENIPAQYLFNNNDEEDFVRVMNRTFDADIPPICPTFSTWDEVTEACVKALQNA